MNRLEQVTPQTGDAILVRELGLPGEHSLGKIGGAVQQRHDPYYSGYIAEFLGRVCTVRLEPAWDQDWRGGVVYRELCPWPTEGDKINPRNHDGHDWRVVLTLLALDQPDRFARFPVQTFDRYYFVVAEHVTQVYAGKKSRTLTTRDGRKVRHTETVYIEKREYARMWIRWNAYDSASGHIGFTPVQDPLVIERLNKEIPR